MERKNKKPYIKPGIVFENFETGEITGTPEMVEKIMCEVMEAKRHDSMSACPYEDIPCMMREAR